MYYVGIDIGSTATKVIVMAENKKQILHRLIMPTGWSSKETASDILNWLKELEIERENCSITATGYGRVSVPYADKIITEITCHGKGALYLSGDDCTVIDIGGQDTKIITINNGIVSNFIMNDKCSAGTGRFLEIMANTLGINLTEIFDLAAQGEEITISSMCTVFAESEVISLIGNGCAKEDIACGVVNSIVNKVYTLCGKHNSDSKSFFLTGGFCDSDYIRNQLSKKLKKPVESNYMARYAGAIGAALLAN
nr:acyl-CoA dehydratase activase [Sedimentibacter sp.]